MISTILNTFKNVIKDQVLQYEGGSRNEVDVEYVRLDNSSGDSLYPDAINIALFGSGAEKDLLGTYKYSTPTSGNNAMNEKPPLRVAIDVLLLFNFSDYLTALRSYDLVLAYFYNNDLLHVSDGGDEINEVQVLLSRFNDLDEIEIWSSFNTPGIPIFRYELKYAIIPGRFDELPMIQKVSATEGILYPEEIGTLIMNMVYVPINDYLNGILTATTTFCSIAVPKIEKDSNQLPSDFLTQDEQESLQQEIENKYKELIVSYKVAAGLIRRYRDSLQTQIKNKELSKVEFEPFIPSMTGTIHKTNSYQDELIEIKPTVDNYYDVCKIAKEKIEGATGLPADFMSRLVRTTEYLNLVDVLEQDIITFNATGGSCYKPVGDYPFTSFLGASDISTMQWRKKWWDIESKMTQLGTDYLETELNELFNQEDKKGKERLALITFKEIIAICLVQLFLPYEEFKILNIEYNKIDPDKSQEEIQRKFRKAYSKCYPAINYYIDGQDVSVVLRKALQNIFIEQNK